MQDRRAKGIRPNAPAYRDTPLLSIGKMVRVQVGSRCRRATIACVDEDDGTVDVLLVAAGGGGAGASRPAVEAGKSASAQGASSAAPAGATLAEDEEATVSAAAVRALEDFELLDDADVERRFVDDLDGAASSTKDDANALHKVGDWDAAAERYAIALSALRRFRACDGEVGAVAEARSPVLVNQAGALVLGRLGDVDLEGRRADVELAAPQGFWRRPQVVHGAPWRSLIRIHATNLQLQTALYMNRARSLSQLSLHQEAAQDLSIAIMLRSEEVAACVGGAAAAGGGEAERRKQLSTAHFLRARTRLARSRFEPARADAREAIALGPDEKTLATLRALEREIDRAQKELRASNKRLAKEIAHFADQAMSNLDSAQLAALGQGADSAD